MLITSNVFVFFTSKTQTFARTHTHEAPPLEAAGPRLNRPAFLPFLHILLSLSGGFNGALLGWRVTLGTCSRTQGETLPTHDFEPISLLDVLTNSCKKRESTSTAPDAPRAPRFCQPTGVSYKPQGKNVVPFQGNSGYVVRTCLLHIKQNMLVAGFNFHSKYEFKRIHISW